MVGSIQTRIAYSAPNTCRLPTPSTRASGSCILLTSQSEISELVARLVLSYTARISRKLLCDFSTVTPDCWTSLGSRDSACWTLFCTCTWAVSGSVPCSKVTVMLPEPSELLVELK